MGGTDTSTEPLTNAEAARLRVLFLAQTVFVLACAGAAALVAWLLVPAFPEESARLITELAGLAKLSAALDKTFGDGTAAGLTARLPWLCAGLIGGAFAWRKRKLVRRVADRLFPLLDAELLRPVQRAGALDPLWASADSLTGIGMQPIEWAEPPAPLPNGDEPPTARRRVWDRLQAFLTDEVGDGRSDLLGQPRPPMTRFRWIVLTGQPGSGKTRMAMELARARARRDVLGDPPGTFAPEQRRELRRARRVLRLGALWRLAIPWVARRERARHPAAIWRAVAGL